MSKTKTKTKKSASKKARKASAEAGTVTIGGREWKRSKFEEYIGREGERTTLEGFARGQYGIFEIPRVDDAPGGPWAYLVNIKHKYLLAIFEGLHAAAVGALIEEALDGWPTYVNEPDGRSFRDEALWASGFIKGGRFCYANSLPVWHLDDDKALKPAPRKAA